MKEALIYAILMNIVGFILSAYDKNSAVRNRRRIQESTLWLTAIMGGSIGLYASMRLFRHKTRHKSFMIGIPALIALQIAACWYVITKFINP